MSAVRIVLALIRGIIADRAELAAENLALRQQLAVLSCRLLHGTDSDVSHLVLFQHTPPSPPHGRPRQRRGASDSHVDSAADHRSFSRR